MKTVAVVGAHADENAAFVAEAVERLGARALRIDTRPHDGGDALAWDGRSARYGRQPLDDVRCFYVKSVHLGLPYFNPEERPLAPGEGWPDRYAAEREHHSLATSVLRSLEAGGRHFVNPVQHHDLHFLKLHQLELLARAGLEVPHSLATRDPAAVRAFAARHPKVIYKPLAGGALVRRLERADLKRLRLLAAAPVLFQEEIAGEELRVYVLAGEVIGAFAAPTTGVVDVRERLERFRPARLSAAEQRACTVAAQTLGLVFTAIDLRRSRKRGPVVLECNPTPAIAFHEDPRSGRVITALASHLVAHA